MRWLVSILEWLVLLPLWRAIFKPRMIQGLLAGGTALVWLVIVIAIAASAGGGGDDKGPESVARPSPTTPSETAVLPSPTAEAPPEPQETIEAQGPERIVAAGPGAAAEAEDVRVTLNEIRDPWISDNQFIQPASGKRFVAFDVTIENTSGSGSHGANPFNFKLSDAQDFAYEATFGGPEAALGHTDLGGGQKTRGWVTFEVNEGTPLSS